MPTHRDFYTILGLPHDATVEEIRRAYHFAALRLHPDTNHSNLSSEPFLKIQEAYEVLNDPKRRRDYDDSLGEAVSPSTAPSPVVCDILMSRKALQRMAEPQWVYALANLEANPAYLKQIHAARPALNICLALDRSTSMKGERMDTVKAAATTLIRQLRPDDVLSVITFADRAEAVVPATRKAEIESAINQVHMIRTGGGTEIIHGLEAAVFEVRKHLKVTGTSHIVLLTDGRTYGDEPECLQLAEEAATQGIGISVLGIGNEWNDNFLDELATATGGSSQYIAGSADILPFIQEKYSRLDNVFADQVRLSLTPMPGVELRGVFRVIPEPAPLATGDTLLFGSLPGTSVLTVLLEFAVSPTVDNMNRVLLANGNFSIHIPSSAEGMYDYPLCLTLPMQSTPPQEDVPDKLVQAVEQATLIRMQERAQSELDSGMVEKARNRLTHLEERLRAQGHQQLARTVQLEVEQIKNTRNLSADGKKRLKYGTRALLMPPQTPGEE